MYSIQEYDIWSHCKPEEKDVLVAYASMHGSTEPVIRALVVRLYGKDVTNVASYDISPTSVSQLISETFRYGHLVLAPAVYNLGVRPAMHSYLLDMKALNVQERTVTIVENNSWACKSGDPIQKFLTEEVRDMTVLNERVSMASALGEDKEVELDAPADTILDSMNEKK